MCICNPVGAVALQRNRHPAVSEPDWSTVRSAFLSMVPEESASNWSSMSNYRYSSNDVNSDSFDLYSSALSGYGSASTNEETGSHAAAISMPIPAPSVDQESVSATVHQVNNGSTE